MKNKMIFMPERNAPLVHLEFALLNGSLRDPDGNKLCGLYRPQQ